MPYKQLTVLWLMVLMCILVGPASAQTLPTSAPSSSQPSERSAILLKTVEIVAAEMKWLDQGFVYDRPPNWGPDPGDATALYNRLRNPPEDILPESSWKYRIEGRNNVLLPTAGPIVSFAEQMAFQPGPWSAADIRPLLHHADPKVRTLGIVLMYQLNRVDVLPEIADLLNDNAVSFSSPLGGNEMGAKPRWTMGEQHVGTFARNVIRSYANASQELRQLYFEVSNNELGKHNVRVIREQLTRFAQVRHPTMCTAALVIAMQRATMGTSPLPDERQGRIQAVLGLLQQIEMPRRFFVALQLDFQERAGERYSPDYLMSLAREVPHDVRIRAVMGQRAIDDPDLSNFGYSYFQAHATELFTVKDADAFLGAPSAKDACWLVKPSPEVGLILAAARLRPASAEAILLPAIDAFKEDGSVGSDMRRDIAIELCLLGGEKGVARGIDWFFAFTPQIGTYGGGREAFLGAISVRDRIRARQVNERIIRDERLKTLGPASTRMLMSAVQGYLGRPLASEADIRESYGIDEAQRDRKLASLAQWHASLQATVDEWSK